MQRKGQNKNPGLILFSALLMLQLSLLPSVLNVMQYYSTSPSHEMSSNTQHHCTCDTEGGDFCPMHQAGDAHHSGDQPYFCGCDYSFPELIVIDSFTPKAILGADLLVGPWNHLIAYADERNLFPSDPYLPAPQPPG